MAFTPNDYDQRTVRERTEFGEDGAQASPAAGKLAQRKAGLAIPFTTNDDEQAQ